MFPLEVTGELPPEQVARWDKQFVETDRTACEGIWRRTQTEANKGESDWQDEGDCRRRMIHFVDKYALGGEHGNILMIEEPYLYLTYALPQNEINDLIDDIDEAARVGDWLEIDGGYLLDGAKITIAEFAKHPEDIKSGRIYPGHYRFLDVTLSTLDGEGIDPSRASQPWEVLQSGLRKKDRRSLNATYLSDASELEQYLPAQLELGGGASIDSGIPGLNYLHGVYKVSSDDGRFIFGNDTLVQTMMTDLARFYKGDASFIYRQALSVEPGVFYKQLSRLRDAGMFVGSVITNNFDGLVSLVGMDEEYVRRYDEAHIIPDIEFHPDAKALIVVGSHADRRRVQHAARNQGLKVIYVDPELIHYSDSTKRYPLESIQDEDILIPKTAAEFAEMLSAVQG